MEKKNEIKQEKVAKVKKTPWQIVKKVIDAIIIAFVALIAVAEITSMVTQGNNHNVPNIFGYQTMIVATDSMAEYSIPEDDTVNQYPVDTGTSYPVGTGIISQVVDVDTIEIGDDITFWDTQSSVVITHRVMEIVDNSGTLTFYCKGINILNSNQSNLADRKTGYNTVTEKNVMGKVVLSSSALGLFISTMQNTAIMAVIVFVPLGLIFIWSIVDVIKAAKMQNEEENNVPSIESEEALELKKQIKEELLKEMRATQIEEEKKDERKD
jgi:hypothetical protein